MDNILSAREKAANLWLEWATDSSHGHRVGAPVNTQYVYDSKFKINVSTLLSLVSCIKLSICCSLLFPVLIKSAMGHY